jgi:hypothetical protein
MTYPSTITITGSTSITNFDIYQCTTNDCSTCVPISGVTGQDVSRSQLLTGHTVSVGVGYRYIKLSSDTETCTNSICMEIIGLPTPTPTSTPTPTPSSTPTPTPTSTPTPTPSSTPVPEPPTPTPSSTPVPPTPVPPTPVPPTPVPPTPTPTTGCVINQYTFTSTGDGASWSIYTTCDNGSLTTITLSGNDSTNICGRAPILQSGTGSVTDDGPCATCFFYDVVVESLDLAMSDNDTVYFGYTNCNGVYQVNEQNNAGSWTNQFCGTNFSGAYIIQNGIQNTGGSTANVTTTPCS